eukprot:g11535.t1
MGPTPGRSGPTAETERGDGAYQPGGAVGLAGGPALVGVAFSASAQSRRIAVNEDLEHLREKEAAGLWEKDARDQHDFPLVASDTDCALQWRRNPVPHDGRKKCHVVNEGTEEDFRQTKSRRVYEGRGGADGGHGAAAGEDPVFGAGGRAAPLAGDRTGEAVERGGVAFQGDRREEIPSPGSLRDFVFGNAFGENKKSDSVRLGEGRPENATSPENPADEEARDAHGGQSGRAGTPSAESKDSEEMSPFVDTATHFGFGFLWTPDTLGEFDFADAQAERVRIAELMTRRSWKSTWGLCWAPTGSAPRTFGELLAERLQLNEWVDSEGKWATNADAETDTPPHLTSVVGTGRTQQLWDPELEKQEEEKRKKKQGKIEAEKGGAANANVRSMGRR